MELLQIGVQFLQDKITDITASDHTKFLIHFFQKAILNVGFPCR